MTVMRKLLDVIEAAEWVDADQEFVGVAASLLALAISRLAPAEREHTLKCIENYGSLRRAVQRYPNASPYPRTPQVMH